jgi:hypothetical protein
VTLRIEAEPGEVRQCRCRQCQPIAAGGAGKIAILASGTVHLGGELQAAR